MKKCSATSPSSKSHYYPVERRKKYILARRPMVVPHLENSMGWYQKFTSASCSIVHTQARDTRPSSDHSNKESTCQELPFLQVISQDLFPWINRTFFLITWVTLVSFEDKTIEAFPLKQRDWVLNLLETRETEEN